MQRSAPPPPLPPPPVSLALLTRPHSGRGAGAGATAHPTLDPRLPGVAGCGVCAVQGARCGRAAWRWAAPQGHPTSQCSCCQGPGVGWWLLWGADPRGERGLVRRPGAQSHLLPHAADPLACLPPRHCLLQRCICGGAPHAGSEWPVMPACLDWAGLGQQVCTLCTTAPGLR